MARELGFELRDAGLQGLHLREHDHQHRPDGRRRCRPVGGWNAQRWWEILHGASMRHTYHRVKPGSCGSSDERYLNGYELYRIVEASYYDSETRRTLELSGAP